MGKWSTGYKAIVILKTFNNYGLCRLKKKALLCEMEMIMFAVSGYSAKSLLEFPTHGKYVWR